MDLRSRMELAGQNLLDCLSAAHGYLPYWDLGIDANCGAEFQMTNPGAGAPYGHSDSDARRPSGCSK